MDLIEFLRARLDEDETAARAAFSGQCDPENGWGAEPSIAGGWTITPHVGNIHEEVQARHVEAWNPARVLAEVEDWRNVLTACEVASREPGPAASYAWVLIRDVVIRPRLARYADHPDFDPAWLSR